MHTYSGPELTFHNSPGKTFTCWRRGKAFPERNWMNELLGRSSEDPESPCWTFAPNSISTAGQGWRSCKTWLGSRGSPPWSCWMWSPTCGTVLTFLRQCRCNSGSVSGFWGGRGALAWELGYSGWLVSSGLDAYHAGPSGKMYVKFIKKDLRRDREKMFFNTENCSPHNCSSKKVCEWELSSTEFLQK